MSLEQCEKKKDLEEINDIFSDKKDGISLDFTPINKIETQSLKTTCHSPEAVVACNVNIFFATIQLLDVDNISFSAPTKYQMQPI